MDHRRRRLGLLLPVIVLAWSGCAAHGAARVTLAAGGRMTLPVVISPQASDATRAVARELAEYLGRIAGATCEVREGDGSRGIVLGTLEEFPDPALRGPLAIRDGVDGKEAYAIRTEADRVRLIAAAPMGVPHAAFRFLEALGCRWFFPAKEWEVVPLRPALSVQLDETDRPAILSRRIWWGYGCFDERCQADYETWARHNRMAQSRTISCGHAWQSIILHNKAVFEAHPEYLALVGGKRQGEQLCVSNPEVRKIAAEWALGELRRQPQRDMVSMECSDGDGQCECDACRRLGSISDRVFGLANEVARAVAGECPGKMVGVLAYNEHCEPPSFSLEPNVYVQCTAGFIRGRYTFDELVERWPHFCRNVGFYEYLSVWPWDFDMPPGGRGANLKYLREQIPRYAAAGATSLDGESSNNWGLHGRGTIVANRLMWNPSADVDALLADFYDRAFGPAAAVIKRYYERLDPGEKPLVGEPLLAMALRDLEEASRLAKDRPDVLARLDHLKQYQHYVRLRWEYDTAADNEVRSKGALAAHVHAFRTRYTYMNHWTAILRAWTTVGIGKNAETPAWVAQQPWKDQPPCTPEETEQLFREDLARFQPQPVRETAFSADLVPSGLGADAPAESQQSYQGKMRYALYSRQGEPLEATLLAGVIAWYRDRPEAAYALADAAGKEIARGRLPLDGAEHPLTLNVPAPGLYWLDVNDQAAGWRIRAAPGRLVTLAPARGVEAHHLGHMQRMFFYVPRGTRRVEYFWNGGPHEVRGPDGKVLAEVTIRGKVVGLDVPAGADGQAWSFTKLSLGTLWFFNVPNYLAASPQALLVPRETGRE